MAENQNIAKLNDLRNKLALADNQIISELVKRMEIVQQIGEIKQKENMNLKQNEFWLKSCEIREEFTRKLNLDVGLVQHVFEIIHQHSLAFQHKNKSKK